MTFTPNIPAAGQSLGSSRTQVLGNFTNYNNLVSVDHLAPNNASQGQHAQVTFNTYGTVANYTQTGTQSYLYAFNASNAGTSLIYQPSIVANATIVPVTPRAVCRVNLSAGNWSLSTNGPYGANSTFNVGSITSTSATQFTVNFSQNLADTNYFVMTGVENSGIGNLAVVGINTKAVGSFNVQIQNVAGFSNMVAAVTIMVF